MLFLLVPPVEEAKNVFPYQITMKHPYWREI